jgi:hypothetical protein
LFCTIKALAIEREVALDRAVETISKVRVEITMSSIKAYSACVSKTKIAKIANTLFATHLVESIMPVHPHHRKKMMRCGLSFHKSEFRRHTHTESDESSVSNHAPLPILGGAKAVAHPMSAAPVSRIPDRTMISL